MRKLLIFGILAAAIAVALLMVQLRPAPPKKESVKLDPLVEVLVLQPMTANFEVTSQGTVRPRTETVLSAEVSGTVTSISLAMLLNLKIGGVDLDAFRAFQIGTSPWLFFTILLIVVGVQFFLMGLLGEMITRTYHESQAKEIYAIREIVEHTPVDVDHV